MLGHTFDPQNNIFHIIQRALPRFNATQLVIGKLQVHRSSRKEVQASKQTIIVVGQKKNIPNRLQTV